MHSEVPAIYDPKTVPRSLWWEIHIYTQSGNVVYTLLILSPLLSLLGDESST